LKQQKFSLRSKVQPFVSINHVEHKADAMSDQDLSEFSDVSATPRRFSAIEPFLLRNGLV
jgi:hypothetical protein